MHISQATQLSYGRVQHALRELQHHGLVLEASARWHLSPRGRASLNTPSGRAMLDVPRSALAA
ncbi:hypothetical protein GCM10011591_43730 [Nocardia camponoti]|uniref:Uncharacterized protein n=1 Tax=Nocardia camponoti TaxID=1616106 RepID=A0A917QTG7_9NOCA|nr:hypothetical protein GCM10011591_43730 [Nocardia camponoti]